MTKPYPQVRDPLLYGRGNKYRETVAESGLEILVQLTSTPVLCVQIIFVSHRWNQNFYMYSLEWKEGTIQSATSFLNIIRLQAWYTVASFKFLDAHPNYK